MYLAQVLGFQKHLWAIICVIIMSYLLGLKNIEV